MKNLFYVITFAVFFIATQLSYLNFQSFIISKLAKIKYIESIEHSQGMFIELLIFSILCYKSDLHTIKLFNLKRISLIYLLAIDLSLLFFSNILLVIFFNYQYNNIGWVNSSRLDNVILVITLIGLKELFTELILKRMKRKNEIINLNEGNLA
ncbi:hypothetical protein C8P68_101891 [Mucilaginibacter yixingensis]|uniref:Uncharacterized protein n=1 Tax=Mucilaginibacter yixingensis TaxID=1295612 RepID=A0A2T5JGX6_9SPHI|nr:hypothetical protein C8P68_101891 [Mucilaginibacter yixingensis]